MKTLFAMTACIFLLGSVAISQQNIESGPKPAGPYLGQNPPGMIPEIFATGIVSTADFEHSKLEFTADGSTYYWAAQPAGNESGSLTQKIWFVKKSNDTWAKPQQLSVDQVGNRSATVFPLTEDIIYIGSGDKSATDAHSLKYDVYRIDKEHKMVEKVSEKFPMLKTCWSFSFAKNGNLYYDHPEGETYDIYCSEYSDGVYAEPQKLNSSINDGNTSVQPFVSPDESYLIFCSFRPGGQGIADLYISFRQKDGSWSDARNMGDTINTEMLERFPSVSPDGRYLFFTRNKGEISDFYWVDAAIIEKLKPKE
ncbi:MAG: hypothetical protein AB1746_09515 [Candidatus Zixiibacteriota bacterium]